MSDALKLPTPAEAARTREEQLQPQVLDLTRRVRQALVKGPLYGGQEIWVDVGKTVDTAIEVVMRRLRAAGWSCRLDHDQRDGTCLKVWAAGGDL
jgi:hypothetical protein